MAKREKFRDLAAEIDTSGEFPHYLVKKFAQMGLLGMTLSPEYGGEGAESMTAILAIEELAKYSCDENPCRYQHGFILLI
jgi:alkylation response protein AidB-like acyl-CoA dehydrogenase